MIVLDASFVVEMLTNTEWGGTFGRRLRGETIAVPHLLDIEVISALRGLTASGRIDSHRVKEYLVELAMLPAQRHGHSSLLDRVWELRHNFTSYDAVYIALAEALNATLYTADAKLRKGHRARVVLVET